ncbi:HAD family hydrolase [Bacteroidota bacterium]
MEYFMLVKTETVGVRSRTIASSRLSTTFADINVVNMTHPSNFKSILFDLGGVILDLNVSGTLEAFLNLGFPKELLNYPNNMHTDIFFKYETGKITTAQFRNEIRELSGIDFSDDAFDSAWCMMLGKVPRNRTELLRSLSKNYQLYMLSNTSELHINTFEGMFFDAAGYSLEEVFTKLFYSHEIGHHKPDPKAFEHVINEAGIQPEETLFLDDNIHNIKAAQELGFHAIHITRNLRMEDVGYDR